MDNKKILQSIDLFNGLTDAQFEMLAPAAELVEKEKDEALFNVGEAARDIFVLIEGKVSLQVKLTSRPETVDIVVLQNWGQIVGWSGLFEESHYTASGVCLEDSKFLRVDGKKLMHTLEADPAAGFSVMCKISKVISMRIRNLQSVVLKTI